MEKGKITPHLSFKASHPLPGPRELSLGDPQVISCVVTWCPPPHPPMAPVANALTPETGEEGASMDK